MMLDPSFVVFGCLHVCMHKLFPPSAKQTYYFDFVSKEHECNIHFHYSIYSRMI